MDDLFAIDCVVYLVDYLQKLDTFLGNLAKDNLKILTGTSDWTEAHLQTQSEVVIG